MLLVSYPVNVQKDIGVPFVQHFNYILRRDHQKNPMIVAPMSR